MKKLNVFLTMLMMVCAIPILGACNNNNPIYVVSLVEIQEQELTMAVGTSYQLHYEVLPSEAREEDKGVQFSSSNPEYVTVSAEGLVTAVRATTTPVTISVRSLQNADANTNTCQVVVVSQKTALSTPANFRYDETNSCLMWDAVNVSGYTPTYELTFVSGTGANQTIQRFTTTATAYADFVAGESYSVTIRTLGNDILYENSPSSETVTFTKLLAPTNIAISTTGSTTEPDARVTVLTFNTSMYAPVIQEQGKLLQNYTLDMRTGKNHTRLNSTNQALWDNAIANATAVENDTHDGWIVSVEIPQTLAAADYSIRITALGTDGSDRYDSDPSAWIDFKKLGAPSEMVLSGNNAQYLTWSTVSGATGYKVVYRYKLGVSDAGSDYSYMASYVEASETIFEIPSEILSQTYSEFYVYMYAIGDGTTVVDSPISTENARYQLGQVEDLAMGNRNASQDIVLTWDSVFNAGEYLITIYHNGLPRHTVSTSQTTYTFGVSEQIGIGDVTEPLWLEGENTITVQAQPGVGSSYIAGVESESISVVKLAAPTSFGIVNGKLSWDTVSGSAGYSLTINNNNETVSIANDVTELEITAEQFGNYYEAATGALEFSMVAKGADSYTNTIDSDPVSVSATKLRTPAPVQVVDGELSFTGQDTYGASLPVQTYELVIERESDDAARTEYETLEFTMNAVSDLREYLSSLNTDYNYYFKIRAKGDTANSSYVLSEYSDYILVHFVAAPTNLRAQNGVITWTAPLDMNLENNLGKLKDGITMQYELSTNKDSTTYLIDAVDEEGYLLDRLTYVMANNVFSDNSQPRISVRVLVSNTTDTTVYLVNSNSITSTFWQLAQVKGIRLSDSVLSWNSVNYANGYQVVLDKGAEDEQVINVTDGTSLNLTESYFSKIGNHTITVYALGDNTTRITSYESSAINIERLGAPTLSVSNGLLRWTEIMNADGSSVSRYAVYLTNALGQQVTEIVSNANNTSLAIPAGNYTSVFVVALADKDNTLSTSLVDARENAILLTKLNAVDLSTLTINAETGTVLQWEPVVLENGSKCLQYSVSLYSYDATGIRTLAETRTVTINSTDSQVSLSIADGYRGGKYEIVVTVLGAGVDQGEIVSGQEGWVNYVNSAASSTAIVQRLSAPLDVHIADNRLYWTPVTGASDTVTSNIRYRIVIYYGNTSTSSTYISCLGIMGSQNPTGFTETDAVDGVALSDLYSTSNISAEHYISPGSSLRIYVYTILDSSVENVFIIPADQSDSGTREVVLYSSYSSVYGATLFQAPTVGVNSSGVMSWVTNRNFNGVEISFYEYTPNPEGEVTVAEDAIFTRVFGYSETTYDLSDSVFTPGDMYVVKVRALGNDREKQTSDLITSSTIVTKLDTINPNTTYIADFSNLTGTDGWFVKDGMIRWQHRTGATAYNITYTQENVSETYVYNTIAEGAIYSYLPNCNSGSVSIQFDVVGGTSTTEYITIGAVRYFVGYVNSVISNAVTVNKLSTVTNLRVEDGEIEWGMRDESNERVDLETDEQGAIAVSNYVVDLAGTDIPTMTIGINDQYIMSDRGLDEGRYTVQVSAVGNNWMGTGDSDRTSASAYLTSSAGDGMIVQVYSNNIDIKVLNGELVWDYNTSNHSNLDYKLVLDGREGTDDQIIYTTDKSTDLAEYVGAYDSIKVRFEGSDSDSGRAVPVVNSAYSPELLNIVKLPDLPKTSGDKSLYINEYGEIEWFYNASSSNLTYGDPSNYDISLRTTVTIDIVNPLNGAISSTYTDSTSMSYGAPEYQSELMGIGSTYLITQTDNNYQGSTSPRYDVSVFVNGSTESSGYADQDSYLNSNPATISAYQFGAIEGFTTDDMILNLLWDISSANIVVPDDAQGSYMLKPDLIMLEYRKNGESRWETKYITGEDISTIGQFFEYGTYSFRISVLKQDQSAIRSAPTYLYDKAFTKFAVGNGSRENPFEIDNPTRLSYVYYLLESYFELTTDIELEALTDGQTSNIPVPADTENYPFDDLEFAGGINGNNYSIKNIIYDGADDFALFNTILGGDVEDTIVDDAFYNKYGIITNLKMEISSMDLNGSYANGLKGILTNSNYGYIVNCTSRTIDNFTGSEYQSVINTDGFQGAGLFFGGIAGYNGKKVISDNDITSYVGVGMISGSTNLISITLTNSSSPIYIGGIAAQNAGGSIINCVNGVRHAGNYNPYNSGDIRSNQAGGIVCQNATIMPEGSDTTQYIYSVISGCVNYGTITASPIQFGGNLASAGIVAENDVAIVTYCANYGTITAVRGSNVIGLSARMGGIVGSVTSGGYITNCYNNGIITTDANGNETQDGNELEEGSQCMGNLVGYNGSQSSALATIRQSVYSYTPAVGEGSFGENVALYENDLTSLDTLNVPLTLSISDTEFNTQVADIDGKLPTFVTSETDGILLIQYV